MNIQQAEKVMAALDKHDHNAYQALVSIGYAHNTATKVAKRTIEAARIAVEANARGKESICTVPSGIYIIGSEDFKMYKIGYSKNPMSRLKSLNNASPFKLDLVAVFPCEETSKQEQYIHEYLAPLRQNGEWFAGSIGDIMLGINHWLYKKTQDNNK